MVLIHRYSVKDRAGFIYTQHSTEVEAHLIEGAWVGKYSLSVHFPHDHFPLSLLHRLYCLSFPSRASCCRTPTTTELTSIHKTPSFDCNGQTGCRVCHHSLPAPTISIRFFPLPQLPSTAVQWGCYPCECCCHRCTPHHLQRPEVKRSGWTPPTCQWKCFPHVKFELLVALLIEEVVDRILQEIQATLHALEGLISRIQWGYSGGRG